MKKIVFGITNLDLGGAERVLVDITNDLVNKYDVTIFTLYGNGTFLKELDKKVKVVSMYDKTRNDLSFVTKKLLSFRLVTDSLRKKIYDKYIAGKYDIEVAFLEGPITWIFSEESDARKIAWIHNDIEDVFNGNESKKELNRKAYEKYNELIFVSEDNLKKFKKYFKDNKVHKQVIYNYLNKTLVTNKASKLIPNEIDKKVLSFVQVSRLVDQKAVKRLIRVHAKLINDGYEHKIYIVGDGPLRPELEAKIKELGVEKTFILLGAKPNPYPYIKKGNYFILTSYYEGYPMVLLEAKSLEKYIMITDSAARETLKGYESSMIVNNSEPGIYEGLKNIIVNKPKVVNKKNNKEEDILKEIINCLEGE